MDDIPPELRSSVMMTFGTKPVTVDSVAAIVSLRADMSITPLRALALKNAINKVIEQLVFSEKVDSTQRHYPEFATIMREYVDGILLYQIEQERIWNSITVNDSALLAYFNSHRDKFVYPDRVEFSELRAVNDSVANHIFDRLKEGETFKEIVATDSARLKAPTSFQTFFRGGSARITLQSAKVLAIVAKELQSDRSLKVRLTAHIDTAGNNLRNKELASNRLAAMKSHFLEKHGISGERIVTISRPVSKGETNREVLNTRIDLEIIGRKSLLRGGIELSLLPDTSDERSLRADSLSAGEFSKPFRHKTGVSIVQLKKKHPSRLKTFEEAGTEVSSAFQEYEARRLEDEWLTELRKRFPVVENREVLKHAFAPVEQLIGKK
jgi:peptidyl-prolyl cis-trans isomerase SurA